MSIFLNRSNAKDWTRAQKAQFMVNKGRQEASAQDLSKLLKNAGISPDEAYREMEDRTSIIMNPAGEFATYSRIAAKSKSVHLGKLSYVYRQASAQSGGTISMSGQTGIITDAGEYKNAGTVIPVIDKGIKRDWRENMTLSADGFDAWVDDAREGALVILRTADTYLWDGNSGIKSPDGYSWLGIKNDTSLVQATVGVDLASSAVTAANKVAEVTRLRDLLRITNNCSSMIELAVSRETLSNWEQTPYSVNDQGFGTILTFVRGLSGIASVYEEPKLSGGFQVLMAYIDLDGLHSVTGQAMSSYMDQRTKHNDPFIMVKWMAQGFVAKNTFSGQKCALYGKAA